MVTSHFDEGRFAALLDMAGVKVAVELAQLLDEDLSRIDLALTPAIGNPFVLHAQSHILLSIAGTIGANQVYDLAQRMTELVRGGEGAGELAHTLAEIRLALQAVILRVRSTRSDLERSS